MNSLGLLPAFAANLRLFGVRDIEIESVNDPRVGLMVTARSGSRSVTFSMNETADEHVLAVQARIVASRLMSIYDYCKVVAR